MAEHIVSAWPCVPFAVMVSAYMQTVPLPPFAVLRCLQEEYVTAMLHLQDSGVPLANDQPAVCVHSCSSSLRQKMVVNLTLCMQWRASGQSPACSTSALLFFFSKAFIFFHLQNQTLSVMLCVQDSGVPLASDEPAVCAHSCSSSSRHSSSSACNSKH